MEQKLIEHNLLDPWSQLLWIHTPPPLNLLNAQPPASHRSRPRSPSHPLTPPPRLLSFKAIHPPPRSAISSTPQVHSSLASETPLPILSPRSSVGLRHGPATTHRIPWLLSLSLAEAGCARPCYMRMTLRPLSRPSEPGLHLDGALARQTDVSKTAPLFSSPTPRGYAPISTENTRVHPAAQLGIPVPL